MLAIALAYLPGLAGGFVFDDFGNLDVLGAFGEVWRWPHFLYYLTSGSADPTGRPIALLSFLLDGSTWPTDPWPFKRTNLVLHLVNTALLAWTMAHLQRGWLRKTPDAQTSHWVPLVAAALWGAHPFLVSTTLYVVQREAMLPMTFILLALMAWSRGVHLFETGRPLGGWIWSAFCFGFATVLAGLSKANGFLAPLLAGLCYIYFLRPDAAPGGRRRQSDTAALVCLALPSALLLSYLLYVGWQTWSPAPLPGRDWSLPERLLSQPRALWDYLLRLAIPRAGGGGVFVEGFAVSRSWWEPATTLPALVALIAATLAALWLRKRLPIVSFAWLYFLAAHLLESSTIGLELYFEHRNYLPAMFLGWPVAQALLRPGVQRKVRLALAVTLIAGLLWLTHQRAVVWGDPVLMSALTASHEADSTRAQVAEAQAELERGETTAALARMQQIIGNHPDSVDVAINAVGLECQAVGALSPNTLATTQQALARSRRWNYGLYIWLREAARHPQLRACRGFGIEGLLSLVAQAEFNPKSQTPARQRDLRHVRGQIALANDDTADALYWFDAALQLAPDATYALVQAAALGNAGDPGRALQHLDAYARLDKDASSEWVRDMPALHRWLLKHSGYYDDELIDLRRRLEADAAAVDSPSVAPSTQP